MIKKKFELLDNKAMNAYFRKSVAYSMGKVVLKMHFDFSDKECHQFSKDWFTSLAIIAEDKTLERARDEIMASQLNPVQTMQRLKNLAATANPKHERKYYEEDAEAEIKSARFLDVLFETEKDFKIKDFARRWLSYIDYLSKVGDYEAHILAFIDLLGSVHTPEFAKFNKHELVKHLIDYFGEVVRRVERGDSVEARDLAAAAFSW